MDELTRIEVHARTIEIGVNILTNTMANMGLNGPEAVVVAGHVLEYLEQKFGLEYRQIIAGSRPDKKLDLVPPPS